MATNNNLFEYVLRLGDSSLILGHRMSEWCGHGPMLEEDIALINIALDLVGRATTQLQYAGQVEGKGRTEDDLAYHRNERDFRNALITEQPNGDYANTIMRSFLFDVFTYYQYEALKNSKDETIAAIAAKSHKEITYHLRHNTDWVLRLGDGTPESHERAQEALNELWSYTGNLFEMNEVDKDLIAQGIACDLNAVKKQWEKHVLEVLQKATLKVPEQAFMQTGSLEGKHSEHLGFLLAEMQYLPRVYPNAKW